MAKETEYNLDDQLERSVEWVKFAEAKNGVAFTLLGALLVELFDKEIWQMGMSGGLLLVIIVVQLMMLIYTFVPRMDPVMEGAAEAPKDENEVYEALKKDVNLNFFGDLCKNPLWVYRKHVVKNYPEYEENSKHFLDVTNQIWINSKIAVIKLDWFKRVCKSMVFSFILLLVVA